MPWCRRDTWKGRVILLFVKGSMKGTALNDERHFTEFEILTPTIDYVPKWKRAEPTPLAVNKQTSTRQPVGGPAVGRTDWAAK